MRSAVKRLQLTSVRVCQRCGRGRAELATDDGATLGIPLDAARARELSSAADDVPSLTNVVLEQFAASGARLNEVVLDVSHGALRALLSVSRRGENDVIGCTPQEGVGLAVRAGLKLYATDEALAHGATRAGERGPETVH